MWEYQIVTDQDRAFFQQAITELLNKGWTCEGGVCVTKTESTYTFYSQALTRNKNDKRKEVEAELEEVRKKQEWVDMKQRAKSPNPKIADN
jgi:hypothetical protein